MVNRILPPFAICAAVAFVACNVSSTPAGPEQRESRSVDLDKSDRVRAELRMPIGELAVVGYASGKPLWPVRLWKPDSGMMRASSAVSTRQKWVDLIRQQEQSGAAVKDFCRDRRVSEPAFYSWRKRLSPTEPVRFALVEAGASVTNARAALSVELILISGDRLRIPAGTDAVTLRTVVSVLRERA